MPHDVEWGGLGRGESPTQQRRNVLERRLKEAPRTKPGTAFEYSNVGYVVAGLMAEQVTGQPWDRLMRERLFDPMGMTTAGFGPPGTRGGLSEPWGHIEHDGKLEPSQLDNPAVLGPAATVHVALPDWAKFALLHLRGELNEAPLLEPATFQTLHTPPDGSIYAGGWGVGYQRGARGRLLTHDGSNTLWYVSVQIITARNLVLLAATNKGGDAAAKACHEALEQLAPPGRA
jgi:CubicO group peptidase (beta-lactamase class C family)